MHTSCSEVGPLPAACAALCRRCRVSLGRTLQQVHRHAPSVHARNAHTLQPCPHATTTAHTLHDARKHVLKADLPKRAANTVHAQHVSDRRTAATCTRTNAGAMPHLPNAPVRYTLRLR